MSMSIWLIIVSAIIFLNTVVAIFTVFYENRDVTAIWAWLLTLIMLPGIGFVIYFFIGKKMSSSQIYDLNTQQVLGMSELAEFQKEMLEDSEYSEISTEEVYSVHTAILLLESNESILTRGNKVEVLVDGEKLFDQFIADIAQATQHVHILYYTFRSDGLGRRVMAALEERAEAGVEVLVIYDALGSRTIDRDFFDRLEEKGGKARVFFGSKIPIVNFRMNYRNHRKILVVDGKIGYMGGFNIGDEYLGLGPLGNWRDTHLRIQGNAVLSLQNRFFIDWNAVVSNEEKVKYEEHYFPIAKKVGETAMQIVASGPENDVQAIKMGFIKMISQAKHSVYIQTPYFIPDMSVYEVIKIAALSGVEVNIMIPNKPDHPFVYRATEYFAKDILDSGANVYTYDKGFFHSKVMVIDNEVASVGSANMDVRSFRLNFEINSFIYDTEVASELASHFNNDIKNSTKLDLEYFMNQSKWRKFKQHFSRLLSPIL
ncbi:Major cardiolipin synthase ClsA [Jeotgalibaca dankookensis]|uniref:Cardiolipin synthase n=2 Tax=Jeotgalibaca dankookensis TaxID=708126 RepID=A0A1S6IMZ9_9LACT|nr:Major cardiolipin synthase ClsA [Jeotgalibaca dankookensis]